MWFINFYLYGATLEANQVCQYLICKEQDGIMYENC